LSVLAIGFFSFAAPSGIVQVLACANTNDANTAKHATAEDAEDAEARIPFLKVILSVLCVLSGGEFFRYCFTNCPRITPPGFAAVWMLK